MSEKSRVPHQKRAIQTKKHIIETAIILFSEKGFHNTSSNEISKVAGVSIGSFYSHFKDKKQLFLEVLDYYSSQIEQKIDYTIILESVPKEKVLTEFIKSVFSAHKILPEFHQEVTAMCLLDADVKKIATHQDAQKRERAYLLLKVWESEMKVSDLYVASFIIYNIVENIVHKAIFDGTDYSEERLINELVDLLLNYLF